MLKYREDLEKVVTKEEIEKRNEIVDKTNERGWFFKKEAKFLLSFEGKARVCNTCGRTLTETKGWRLVSAPDRYGNNLQIGYAANCFECEMRDIMSFDLYNLYKWCYSRHQIKSSLTWSSTPSLLIPPFEHSISPNEIIQMPGLMQTKTFLMAYFRRFIHIRIIKIELHKTAGIPYIDI